jgi:hypothetical protein
VYTGDVAVSGDAIDQVEEERGRRTAFYFVKLKFQLLVE